jgi:type IV secretion system protein VirD4
MTTSTMMNNPAVGPQVRQRRKSRGKLVPIMGATSLLGGLWGATQHFAHTFNFHVSLGMNVGHVYLPWHVLGWAAKWHGVYPQELMTSGGVGAMVAAGGLIATMVVQKVIASRPTGNQYMHGSARWATLKDIQAAGLLPREARSWRERMRKLPAPSALACYVGGWIDKQGVLRYLRHTGPEHILCYAPTRSGKGVGLVIPTLLSWIKSAFISDMKGELWELTSGWRKLFAKNKCLKFEPAAAEGGAHWNALDEVRLGTEYEVGDVQNVAQMIVDPDGKGLESHWQKTSFSLLQGVILHALYKARNKDGPRASLPVVDHMLADPQRATADLWVEMTQYEHLKGRVHPVVGAAARDQLDRHEEEAGSVLSTLKSYLALYRDPVVARNVADSHFRIKDLMHHESPVSLYLVTQPADKERLRPLMRLLVTMTIRVLADKLGFEEGQPVPSYKHKLLMMLDELAALRKLPVLEDALSWMAGYGIKAFLVIQDITQLRHPEHGYGASETISSNCHVQSAFPPSRVETAEYLSRQTGQTTVLKEAITVSGKRVAFMESNVSRTVQEVARNLLTADEAMRMPGPVKDDSGLIMEPGDMVVYVAGRPAIYGKQPLYFKDPAFLARSKVPAPRASDRIKVANEPQVPEAA